MGRSCIFRLFGLLCLEYFRIKIRLECFHNINLLQSAKLLSAEKMQDSLYQIAYSACAMFKVLELIYITFIISFLPS